MTKDPRAYARRCRTNGARVRALRWGRMFWTPPSLEQGG